MLIPAIITTLMLILGSTKGLIQSQNHPTNNIQSFKNFNLLNCKNKITNQKVRVIKYSDKKFYKILNDDSLPEIDGIFPEIDESEFKKFYEIEK
jgi:hypothetical protein